MQRPTVLLRHELPDATHHFDWLIDLGDVPDAPLTTFRLSQPIHTLNPNASLDAQRLPDHRRFYLDYEGPVSGSRGSVRRIAAGHIQSIEQAASHIALTVQWLTPQPSWQRIEIRPESDHTDDCVIVCISQLREKP